MRRLLRVILMLPVVSLCTPTEAQDKVHDWAQFYRYEQVNKETDKATTILYGNSITDFWIGYDPQFFADYDLTDRGISGQTTSEMLVRFRRDVIDLKPQTVVILAGINDIAQNNGYISLENILNNIRSMVELAQLHHIRPVLCSLLPTQGFSWRPEIDPVPLIRQFNMMLRQYCADNKITYVNYYDSLATSQGALNPKLTADGCHPNIKGYRIMEPILIRALNLKKKKHQNPTPKATNNR